MPGGARVDRSKRQIAAEVLDSQAVLAVHQGHQFWRVAHVYRDGLTDKEYRWLMARHKNFEQETTKLSQLAKRLRNNGSAAHDR